MSACPICDGRTSEDETNSESMAVTAMRAVRERDSNTLRMVNEQVTPFDYHVLCGMYLEVVMKAGVNPDAHLAAYRRSLNARIAAQAAE